MHVYVKGGHAFGLHRTESSITAWSQLVEAWLRTIGMMSIGSEPPSGKEIKASLTRMERRRPCP